MVSSRRHHRRLSILSEINLAIATGSSWQYYKPFNSIQDQLVTTVKGFVVYKALSILSKINGDAGPGFSWRCDVLSILSKINTKKNGKVYPLYYISFNSIQDQLGTVNLTLVSL